MVRFVRSPLGDPQVIRLNIRQFGQSDPEFGEMQSGDFFIEGLRQNMDLVGVFPWILKQLDLRHHLIGK